MLRAGQPPRQQREKGTVSAAVSLPGTLATHPMKDRALVRLHVAFSSEIGLIYTKDKMRCPCAIDPATQRTARHNRIRARCTRRVRYRRLFTRLREKTS